MKATVTMNHFAGTANNRSIVVPEDQRSAPRDPQAEDDLKVAHLSLPPVPALKAAAKPFTPIYHPARLAVNGSQARSGQVRHARRIPFRLRKPAAVRLLNRARPGAGEKSEGGFKHRRVIGNHRLFSLATVTQEILDRIRHERA